MPNYRPKRVDGNQSEIIRALERCGCAVRDVSQLGGLGFDLIVKIGGTVLLLEVKNPAGRGDKLTDSEKDAQRDFGGSYHVVRSVDEALALLK